MRDLFMYPVEKAEEHQGEWAEEYGEYNLSGHKPLEPMSEDEKLQEGITFRKQIC